MTKLAKSPLRIGKNVRGTTSRGTKIAGKVAAIRDTARGIYVDVMQSDKSVICARPSMLKLA